METKDSSQKKTPRKLRKITIILSCIILAFVLLIAFGVPGMVSSSMGKGFILGKINSNLDGEADFSDLSMSWYKGIKVTNISFKDNKGLINLAINQLKTKPKYSSLLTGAISLSKTVIDKPVLEITAIAEKIAQKKTSSKAPTNKAEDITAVELPLKNLDATITDGALKITSLNKKTTQLSNINSSISLRSLGQVSTFDLDANVNNSGGSNGKVSVDATVKPDKNKGWTLEGTNGDIKIEVDKLDLESLEGILDLAKVDVQAKGLVSSKLDGKLKDGQLQSLKGNFNGEGIDIAAAKLKGDRIQTNQANIYVDLTKNDDIIEIEDLTVSTDWADAQVKGAVPMDLNSVEAIVSGDSTMDLNGNFAVNVAKVLSQLPNTTGLKKGMVISSGNLNGNIATSSIAGKRVVNAKANLMNLTGKVDQAQIKLSEPLAAELKLSSDKTSIYYDKVNVTSAFCKINCNGTNKLMNYNADVDLAKLQAELGQFIDTKQTFAGRILSQGQVATSKNKVNIKGTSSASNLVITSAKQSASEPSAKINYDLEMDQQENILKIALLKMNALKLGNINISNGTLPLNKDSVKPTKMKISADVDITNIRPFVELSGAWPKDLLVEGKAKSTLLISSLKNVYKISTNLTHVDNLKIQNKDKKPFEQNYVDIKFDTVIDSANKNIEVKGLEMLSPQIKITQGQLKRHSSKKGLITLAAVANCQYDWQAVSNISSQFLPEGFNLEGHRDDLLTFNSTYLANDPDGMMANLNSNLKTGFESAEYMGFEFSKTDLAVDINKGVMTIQPFTSTVNEGTLKFASSADFNQKPALLKTPGKIQVFKDIKINDVTTQKLLKYINPIFADAVNVSGIINFQCDEMTIPLTKGATKDITMEGTMSIDQLKLQASNVLKEILEFSNIRQEQVITIKPTKFTIADEILKYDDMPMEVGQYPLNFGGTINIGKSKKLDMDVVLPYTIEGKKVKIGETASAARVVVPLTGTIHKPGLNLDKLIETQLQQQLENVLKDVFK